MGRVELVEPTIERRHSLSTIEFIRDGALGQRRHVQPRPARLVVEVVRETDVPASHTQIIHTGGADGQT